jgi:hypothetical protein
MMVGVCRPPVERSVSPNSAARLPSGTKSVRVSSSPFGPGRFMREYPNPEVKRVAGPIQLPSIPNQIPSSSFSGGVQTPPISPRMCQPEAGKRPASLPTT